MGAQPLLEESQSVFVVDLDNSLLRTDLLLEKCIKLLSQSPIAMLQIPLRLLRGRLAFKQWINEKVELDYSTLPVRNEVLEKVKQARMRGEKTLILSASLQEDVSKVAKEVPFFDVAVGSKTENLLGKNKLSYLHENYPSASLTYVGDGFSDLKVWEGCDKVVAVNPSLFLTWQIRLKKKPTEFVFDESTLFKSVIKELRIYQWAKNFLVFLPVFAAHKFFDINPWLSSLRMFFAFSFLASSVYVFNDICDLSSDRKQPSKKNRPLASGNLSLKVALFLVPLCLLASLGVSWGLGKEALSILGFYLVMNIVYSFWVKKLLVLDVIFLAGFYTLRIFAGGAASDTLVSEWLLSFSVFFFFGLAMVKRYSELKAQSLSDFKSKTGRRAYDAQDLLAVLISGIAASTLSILILALYLSTGEVRHLYKNPNILWFVTPCLLYWINRLWILGARGKVTEDPLVFALSDKITWCVGGAIVLIMLKAI